MHVSRRRAINRIPVTVMLQQLIQHGNLSSHTHGLLVVAYKHLRLLIEFMLNDQLAMQRDTYLAACGVMPGDRHTTNMVYMASSTHLQRAHWQVQPFSLKLTEAELSSS